MRAHLLAFAVLWLLFLLLLAGCASQPAPDIQPISTPTLAPPPSATPTPEPVWSYLTNANFVSQIAEDSEGNIWSVGSGGVVRWDAETRDYRKFTRADGLPASAASCVATTDDGSVWVGLFGGIARYKDSGWTLFTVEDGLADMYPLVLAPDPDGGLWAGFSGGVSHYDGSRWTSHSTGLLGNRFDNILQTEDGQVWVGSELGVSLLEDGEWTTFKIGARFVDSFNPQYIKPQVVNDLETNVLSISQGPDGSIWFGTGTGGARYRNSTWSYFTKKEGLLLSKILWDIAFDGAGVPWGVFHGPGLFRYGYGQWSYLTQANGLPDVSYIHMAVPEPGGGVWFGTREDGALLTRYPKWTLVNQKSGLGSDNIADILPVEDGYTWFAHRDAGLTRLNLKEQDFRLYQTGDQLPSNHVMQLAIGPDGALWIGNPFVRFDGTTWEDFSDNPILKYGKYDPWVYSMAYSDDGTLWLGQSFGGMAGREALLVSWDGKDWQTYGHEGEVMEGKATDIDFASDGSVWVLIDHSFSASDPVGVAHYDGVRWEYFSSEEGLPSKDPTCLAVDRADVVWVGTNDAELLRYDGQAWTRITHADGLQGTKILSLYADNEGTLWVGTDAGVSAFDGKEWEVHQSEVGLAHNTVYDIEQAPDGAMWFATALGASRFHQGMWQTFTAEDGLGWTVVADIEVAPDGAIWFMHSEGGLSRYGPPQ